MYKRVNMLKGGYECGVYNDPSIKYKSYGGSKNRKQKGGYELNHIDYPFEGRYNEYPIPSKVTGNIDSNINTNFVSNKDMYGCLEQKGGRKKIQKGGNVNCSSCISSPMMLGGSKKQKGSGFGYEMNIQNAITNRPEVSRYNTEGTGYTLQKGGVKKVGGSMASDNLMEYFLNFQTRCRGTEIY